MNNNLTLSIPPATRQLVTAWLALATGVLGAVVLVSLVLLCARLPYLGQWLLGADLLQMALVLHVNWAVTVGFAAFAGVLWSLLGGTRWLAAMWLAFWLCASGALVMGLSPLLGPASPLPIGYLPLLDNPYYFVGAGSFAAGFVLMLLRTLLVALPEFRGRDSAEYASWAAYAAALATLVALGAMVWSGITLPSSASRADLLAALSWSYGHVIQFSYLLLMLAVWLWFAQQGVWALRLRPPSVAALLGAGMLPVLAVPLIYLVYGSTGEESHSALTRLMTYGSGLMVLPLSGVMAAELFFKRTTEGESGSFRTALLVALLLVLLGMVAGAGIRQDNAMVSAHFHAILGAVLLSFMVLALDLLPRLSLHHADGGLRRRLPVLFGSGFVLLVAGFGWAGLQGVPRKLMGAPYLEKTGQELVVAGLTGVGGMLAIAAIVVFLLLMVRAGRFATAGSGVGELDLDLSSDKKLMGRPLGHALAISLVLAASAVFSHIPASNNKTGVPTALVRIDPRANPSAHGVQARDLELRARFEQSVTMLHAKKYEYAIAALHRVLALAPKLPEGHVNMGYALLGLERYDAARDFFLTAIELNPMQANAYYGLAVALEKMKDLPGAIGAMRTYLHLADPQDPYVRKAQSAMWEWEAALGRKPELDVPPSVPRGAKVPAPGGNGLAEGTAKTR
jgi:hypothetical protein